MLQCARSPRPGLLATHDQVIKTPVNDANRLARLWLPSSRYHGAFHTHFECRGGWEWEEGEGGGGEGFRGGGRGGGEEGCVGGGGGGGADQVPMTNVYPYDVAAHAPHYGAVSLWTRPL